MVLLGTPQQSYSKGRPQAVVYTGMEPGGQLTTTTEGQLPRLSKGVDGPSMMVELQQQAERFGTEVRIGHVQK